MIDIKNTDFLSRFPPVLQQDESMFALGKLIAEELQLLTQQTGKNIVYANIDTLPETWVDVLAYDLHVDWYNYDYPVEAKRAIVKDSVKVHQKLGTKAAVEMALGGLHPNSKIEEWFEYGGQPYRFRIVLDTTESRVAADYDEIVKTVDIYKRLSAHLDGAYYQGSVSVAVKPTAEHFIFDAEMTGQIKTGTEPYRSTEGAIAKLVIAVHPTAEGYIAEAIRTGTKPDRSVVLAEQESKIVTDSDTENFSVTSGFTGQKISGAESRLAAEHEAGGISQLAETESYQYSVRYCGANGLSK